LITVNAAPKVKRSTRFRAEACVLAAIRMESIIQRSTKGATTYQPGVKQLRLCEGAKPQVRNQPRRSTVSAGLQRQPTPAQNTSVPMLIKVAKSHKIASCPMVWGCLIPVPHLQRSVVLLCGPGVARKAAPHLALNLGTPLAFS